ncbi:MAG: non-canonical purine NTP pyrophosphatase, partial [Polyangiaceae bacterium]
GRPGVRSARFAHDVATDAENNAALLAALGEGDEFSARFRCALVLIDPFTSCGAPHEVEGVCEGSIVRAERGSGGFGYDALFVAAGMDRTLAELSLEEKNRVSHRARAFAALRPLLAGAVEERRRQLARLG